MTDQLRQITVNLHDMKIGIWQDNPNDPTFRTDVFDGLLRQMKRRGWKVTADPEVLKHHRCISSNFRLAARAELRAEIRISGRVVELEFWAETWPLDNRNGQRYDFNKLQRLGYLDRLRFELERRRILDWLATIATVAKVKASSKSVGPGFGQATAMEAVERSWSESWHSDKELGRPVCKTASYANSGDGGRIEHGATVWFIGRDRRIRRGTAFYHINNMWFVVAGRYELHNLACHEIFCHLPEDLRQKRNGRQRRVKLESLLTAAILAMDFRRAELLRQILFGDEPVFMIWSRDNSAWYRSNYSGYTTETVAAGRYTRTEAEREVRRVPHILSLVGLDGVHVRFDGEEKAAA